MAKRLMDLQGLSSKKRLCRDSIFQCCFTFRRLSRTLRYQRITLSSLHWLLDMSDQSLCYVGSYRKMCRLPSGQCHLHILFMIKQRPKGVCFLMFDWAFLDTHTYVVIVGTQNTMMGHLKRGLPPPFYTLQNYSFMKFDCECLMSDREKDQEQRQSNRAPRFDKFHWVRGLLYVDELCVLTRKWPLVFTLACWWRTKATDSAIAPSRKSSVLRSFALQPRRGRSLFRSILALMGREKGKDFWSCKS